MSIRAAFLALAAIAGTVAHTAAQAPFAVRVDEGAPVVVLGEVLADAALEDAVRSGLPLRLRFRVELWRDGFFDDLERQVTWTAVLAYEPLERQFLAAPPAADSVGRFPSYAAARTALETAHSPPVGPPGAGTYYYLAFLEIETLSLSDLDELERWLRGELEPAVRGGGSVTGAIGTGLKRILVRVLGLPARHYEARSPSFEVPKTGPAALNVSGLPTGPGRPPATAASRAALAGPESRFPVSSPTCPISGFPRARTVPIRSSGGRGRGRRSTRRSARRSRSSSA